MASGDDDSILEHIPEEDDEFSDGDEEEEAVLSLYDDEDMDEEDDLFEDAPLVGGGYDHDPSIWQIGVSAEEEIEFEMEEEEESEATSYSGDFHLSGLSIQSIDLLQHQSSSSSSNNNQQQQQQQQPHQQHSRRGSSSRYSFGSAKSAPNASNPNQQQPHQHQQQPLHPGGAQRRLTISVPSQPSSELFAAADHQQQQQQQESKGGGVKRSLTRQFSRRARKSLSLRSVTGSSPQQPFDGEAPPEENNSTSSPGNNNAAAIRLARKSTRRTSFNTVSVVARGSGANAVFDSVDSAVSSLGPTGVSSNVANEWETVAAAAAVVAAGTTSTASRSHIQFAVGEKVLVFLNILNHTNSVDAQDLFTITPVNKYGFPPGEGKRSGEQQGPYVYVLCTVRKVHFDEDLRYYTVSREDTGAEQRADTGELCKKCACVCIFIFSHTLTINNIYNTKHSMDGTHQIPRRHRRRHPRRPPNLPLQGQRNSHHHRQDQRHIHNPTRLGIPPLLLDQNTRTHVSQGPFPGETARHSYSIWAVAVYV